MLNISNYKVEEAILNQKPTSLSKITDPRGSKVLLYCMTSVFAIAFIIMFLPWTQNVRSKGKITTLRPEQRPQTIHSIIPGKVKEWYVKEGDLLNQGDTIMAISEIKADYMDPNLIARIETQVLAKTDAVTTYQKKIDVLENYKNTVKREYELKNEQVMNKFLQSQRKVITDSASYIAAKQDYDIALRQYNRTKELFEQGLKSKTDLEEKKQKWVSTDSKMLAYENKFSNSRNQLVIDELEIRKAKNDFFAKTNKASSDKFTAETSLYQAQSDLAKLKIKLKSYRMRSDNYYITAPQDCYITKSYVPGIGEVIKDGQAVVSIMPKYYELAAELYVEPKDYALIHKGVNVRLVFDGWPRVVFSGWPNASFGTYSGKIVAIDQNISENGKYRVLVAQEPNEVPWPKELRAGSGVQGMALLNNVKVAYELWRNLSGFPPEYYTAINEDKQYKNKPKSKNSKNKY